MGRGHSAPQRWLEDRRAVAVEDRTYPNRGYLEYHIFLMMHAASFPPTSMHLFPEANFHRSPTCTTLPPAYPGTVAQSVLQASSYTDLDLFDRSAYPCSLCDVFRHVLRARRQHLPTANSSCNLERAFVGWQNRLQALQVSQIQWHRGTCGYQTSCANGTGICISQQGIWRMTEVRGIDP